MGAWLRDRAMRRHLFGLALLLGGFLAVTILHAQGSQSQQIQIDKPPSLIERWLTPDVVFGGVLALMYLGELRGDIARIKKALDEAQTWRLGLNDYLDEKYMSRDAAEVRFASTNSQVAALERRIG